MKWISAQKQLPEVLGLYFVKYWHIGESTTEPCKMAVGVFSYKHGKEPVFYCMNAGYTEVHPFTQEILWLDESDEAVS